MSDTLHPDVLAWEQRKLAVAGDRARADALLKAVREQIQWVPDPLPLDTAVSHASLDCVASEGPALKDDPIHVIFVTTPPEPEPAC